MIYDAYKFFLIQQPYTLTLTVIPADLKFLHKNNATLETLVSCCLNNNTDAAVHQAIVFFLSFCYSFFLSFFLSLCLSLHWGQTEDCISMLHGTGFQHYLIQKTARINFNLDGSLLD